MSEKDFKKSLNIFSSAIKNMHIVNVSFTTGKVLKRELNSSVGKKNEYSPLVIIRIFYTNNGKKLSGIK